MTEEAILDCKRLRGQPDGVSRVVRSLPKMVAAGLITQTDEPDPIYAITPAGLEYISS